MIEKNAGFLKHMQCKGVPFLLKPQKSGRPPNIIARTMEVKYAIKKNYLKCRNMAERLLCLSKSFLDIKIKILKD